MLRNNITRALCLSSVAFAAGYLTSSGAGADTLTKQVKPVVSTSSPTTLGRRHQSLTDVWSRVTRGYLNTHGLKAEDLVFGLHIPWTGEVFNSSGERLTTYWGSLEATGTVSEVGNPVFDVTVMHASGIGHTSIYKNIEVNIQP